MVLSFVCSALWSMAMSSLIAGSSTDPIQSVMNRALVAKKNSSQKNEATDAKSTQSIPTSSVPSANIGLYNNRGVVPVYSPNKADEDLAAQNSSKKEQKNTVIANGGSVRVNISKSQSGTSDKIYWSTDNFQTSHYIASNKQAASFDLGTFAPGTNIQFGIDNGSSKAASLSTASGSDNEGGASAKAADNTVNIGLTDINGGADNASKNPILTVTNVNITDLQAPAVQNTSNSLAPADATVTPAHFAQALGRQASSVSNNVTNPFLFGINTYSEGASTPGTSKIQLGNSTNKDGLFSQSTSVANNDSKSTPIFEVNTKSKPALGQSISIENKDITSKVGDKVNLNNVSSGKSNAPELFNQTVSGAKLKNQLSFQSSSLADSFSQGINDTHKPRGIGHSINFKDVTRHSPVSIAAASFGTKASGIAQSDPLKNNSIETVSSSSKSSAQPIYSSATHAFSNGSINYNAATTASTLDVKLLKALYLNQ